MIFSPIHTSTIGVSLTDKTPLEAELSVLTNSCVYLTYLRIWQILIAALYNSTAGTYFQRSVMILSILMLQSGARGSIMVKALCYKPEGSGFDTQ
jgi:hypothetical protein